MDHYSDDTVMKPGTESYVVDYGFLARAQLQRDLTASFMAPMVSGLTDQNSLRYSLENSMMNAVKDDKQTFLPLGQLDAICNRNAVQDQLLRTFKPNSIDITQYVNYVCGDPTDPRREEHASRKIFAILVLIDQLHMITTFLEEGIKDKHLPFRKSMTGDGPNDFSLMRRSTLDQSNPQTMNFFNNWNLVDKRKFYQTQWQLLSPFFGKAPRDSAALYKLDEQTIMPWVSMGKEQTGAYVPLENIGGYSTVRKIVIHPDHHSFETEFFAVKDLFDADEDPFETEFNNLKKVKTRKHLLPVHAAYVCGTQYSFIFPWAHGGSLEDLWKKEPRSLVSDPERDFHVLVKWIAGQLSGLTGDFGLKFLHGVEHPESSGNLVVPGAKPFGIHGDIKPSNILYFKQDSNNDHLNAAKDLLKISDFGLTGFHSKTTRSRLPATGPHSPTYRSPEWGRDGMDEAFLSRKYDIWSLGCVFLEFLTWVINGPEALKGFNEDRRDDTRDTGTKFREDKYFVIDGKRRYIKPSVTQCVKKLQDQVGEGNYLHDCLGFIIKRMLEISDNKRADCTEVNKFLEEHYKLCIQNEEYSKIHIGTRDEPISRESSRSNTNTAGNESSPVIALNGEFWRSDPSERPLSYPPITVTGPQDEDVDHSPHMDHPGHSGTPLSGSHSHQEIPQPQEECPPGQTSPPEQPLPGPPSVPIEGADTPPETATPILNGSAPQSQPFPQEKRSLKQASFTQRIRNSKWFCFS
ncbi:kinase-like domain-containing protein [Xylaria telfairii]|nr:kinase-like domain-containing protein [Xylaria telfairii]